MAYLPGVVDLGMASRLTKSEEPPSKIPDGAQSLIQV